MFCWPSIARQRACDPLAPRRVILAPVRVLVLCGALPVLLVAGCGSSDNGVTSKPAGQILAAARAAAQAASSVRITAEAKNGGATLAMNAILAKGQAHVRFSLLGVEMEAIRAGETIYVKGNRTYDARLERNLGLQVPAGTWLKGPVSGPLGRVGGFTDIKTEVPLTLSGTGPVTKGATVKIHGQPAIEVKQARKLSTTNYYVATTGQPYPLKLTKTGRETGQTTFTGWNDPAAVTPPANAVEISQLQHLKKGH